MLKAFDFRNNAIGALRLFFASLVVLGHAYPLGGLGADPVGRWSRGPVTEGSLAVACFFVLSGFLIARSAQSTSFVRFLWHRFLRIFPAFWVCLAATAAFIAPCIWFIEHGTVAGYLTARVDNPLRYVAVNADLSMRQYGIGGLLANVPYPRTIDGSLWTLRVEFACYVLIGLAAFLPIIRSRRFILLVGFAAAYVAYAIPIALQGHLAQPWAFEALLRGANRNVAELFVYFGAGAIAYRFRDIVPLNRSIGAVSLVACVLALHWTIYAVVLPIALPLATLWLAAELPLRNIDRRVDLSYGVYIYAFPLQQLGVSLGCLRAGVPVFVIGVLLVTVAFAYVSWSLVERPALRLKNVPFSSLATSLAYARPRAFRIRAGEDSPGKRGLMADEK